MKSLRDALPNVSDPGPIPADELCPRCGAHSQHDCCECCDGGRVRVRLDRTDPQFGRSIPCPSCRGRPDLARPTLEEYLRRARVPRLFQHVTYDSWQLMKYTGKGNPKARVADWLGLWPPEKPFLALFGQRGTGKTTLAFAALRAAFESHGVMGLAWNCSDLMARYRATMHEGHEETEQIIDRELERASILLLDDYGAQQETEWAQSKLYGVINKRYERRSPMIVTSNAALSADRTVSRLIDVHSTVAVQFDGKDVRTV